MKVRGSVVQSINTFVKEQHTTDYEKWLSKLPHETADIMQNAGSSQWYSVNETILEPTQQMCDLFYPTIKDGAWKSGKYSAQLALKGIFKVFVAVSSPSFLMKRASRVLGTFYTPSEIKVVNSTDKTIYVNLNELPVKDPIVEYRIAGWMEGALEICGCKGLEIRIGEALSSGHSKTELHISWD